MILLGVGVIQHITAVCNAMKHFMSCHQVCVLLKHTRMCIQWFCILERRLVWEDFLSVIKNNAIKYLE